MKKSLSSEHTIVMVIPTKRAMTGYFSKPAQNKHALIRVLARILRISVQSSKYKILPVQI